MKKIVSVAVFFAVAISSARFAAAQSETYPARPVRLIVAFPPGGSVDAVARLLGPPLSASLGQPMVIENRSGASGNIGTELAARAKPDGTTLIIHTIPFVANAHLYERMPYDPIADFAPVSLLCSSPAVLIVHPSVPARSVSELLQLAKAKPGALNYSAAGAGTNPHIAGELFNMLGNVDIVAIQYKGSGPAAIGLLSGEAQVIFAGVTALMSHVRAKRIVALAVTSPARSPIAPEVPTLVELGVRGVEAPSWYSIVAPAASPTEVIGKLHAEIVTLAARPDYREPLERQALEPTTTTPEQFAAFLKAEYDKWGRVIQALKLQ